MSNVTIGGFLADLDRIVSGQRAAGWDVNGLQLGDPAASARRVGVCHEVTEAVVSAVEREPVDLVVTYHPLLFQPTNRLVAGRSPAGRAFRLLRTGVAVAVLHTAFDTARGGTSDALAAALGVEVAAGFGHVAAGAQSKIVTFLPPADTEPVAAAMAAAGGGRIGAYTGCSFRAEGTGAFVPGEGARPVAGRVSEPAREPETRLEMIVPTHMLDPVVGALLANHPYEEPAYDVYAVEANLGMVGRAGRVPSTSFSGFADHLRGVLGAGGGLRAVGDGDLPIERVAVVPGSGGSFVPQAAATGADVLVTGDLSHHTMVEAADRGLAVVDVGHTPSERPGMRALAALLAESAPDLVDLTGHDPRPW